VAPDGRVLVSVRAESVAAVDKAMYDCWVLDTATRTLERLEQTSPTPDSTKAQEIYKHAPEVWRKMIHDALKTIEI